MCTGSPTLTLNSTIMLLLILILLILMLEFMYGPIKMPLIKELGECISHKPPPIGHISPSTMHQILATMYCQEVKGLLAIVLWTFLQDIILDQPEFSTDTTLEHKDTPKYSTHQAHKSK